MFLRPKYELTRLTRHIRNFCSKKEVRVRFAPSPTGKYETTNDPKLNQELSNIFILRIFTSWRAENCTLQLLICQITQWQVHSKDRRHGSDEIGGRSNRAIVQRFGMGWNKCGRGSPPPTWRRLRTVYPKWETRNLREIYQQTAGNRPCLSLLLFR